MEGVGRVCVWVSVYVSRLGVCVCAWVGQCMFRLCECV